jgi:hypothetical protein
LHAGAAPLNSVVESTSNNEILISLGEVDFNHMAQDSAIAVSVESTLLAIQTGALADMHGNIFVAPVSPPFAIADEFYPDVLSPTLREFSLDMSLV